MPTARVSIIEDDHEVCESLRALFNGAPGFRCVATYATAEAAVASLPATECDVVLVDLGLPPKKIGTEGIACIRKIKQLCPQLLSVVFTVYEDNDKIFECLKAGASGYLLKKTPYPRLVESILELVDGGSPMSPGIARRVIRHFHDPSPKLPPAVPALSDRELETLDHLSRGRPNKEIAELLGLSAHTVGNYIRRIYEKLQVNSRAEATRKYLGR